MCAKKMHDDEFTTDAALVRRLLAAQFPEWASLEIEQFHHSGTDNALYRLDGDMVVRLPRTPRVVSMVEREHRWLPVLAPQLPLAIPVPIAQGLPAEGYPWHWSIYPWLEGADAATEPIVDLDRAAADLAEFVAALRRVDPTGGPLPGPHNVQRGAPLAVRDPFTRQAIEVLGDTVDTDAVIAIWESALEAPAWDAPGVWIHGDIDQRNLLVHDGRISAVIDWGCLAVGDPAYDVMVAWTLFSGKSRETFRSTLDVDDAMWARARALVLSGALRALPYYMDTNPGIVALARHSLSEVLADDNL